MTSFQQDERNLTEETDFAGLTSEIVSAYVARNWVSPSDLPALIENVHRSLIGAVSPPPQDLLGGRAAPTRAQIRRSVRPDHIVSFEDDKPYKTLTRHLSVLGLTSQTYRAKWGLPADYPMTAPSYSAQRSELAKSIGFGQRATAPVAADPAALPAEEAAIAPAPAKPKRMRARKAKAMPPPPPAPTSE